MHNNVIETYGQDRFPGMDICAKSGTAEVARISHQNAWFTGFLRDEATPYAFIVLVENGGGGNSSVCRYGGFAGASSGGRKSLLGREKSWRKALEILSNGLQLLQDDRF